MIIREGQRKVIMPDRIGGRERDTGILCADEEREKGIAGAPPPPRKTANPRNYLEVSCFRLSRAFETSGINSVPYYRSDFTRSAEGLPRSGNCYVRSNASIFIANVLIPLREHSLPIRLLTQRSSILFGSIDLSSILGNVLFNVLKSGSARLGFPCGIRV